MKIIFLGMGIIAIVIICVAVYNDYQDFKTWIERTKQ